MVQCMKALMSGYLLKSYMYLSLKTVHLCDYDTNMHKHIKTISFITEYIITKTSFYLEMLVGWLIDS